MTLFEILIAFFILSLSLLGLDAALLYSLHQSKTIYYVSEANQQLDNLAEQLFVAGNQPFPSEQFNIWNQQNRDLLPNGRGNVSYEYPNLIISIFWGKENLQICKQNKIGKSGCLRTIIKTGN